MSFMKASIKPEDLQEGPSGSKYISKSGIYDVTLKITSVDVNDSGARSLNFNTEDEDGNETTFYGLKLENNDGSKNFEADVFNRLIIVANLEEVNDPEEQEHLLGKDKKPTTLAVLTDFDDLQCKIRVQEEYSKVPMGRGYKTEGQIKKKMVIKNFYRADGASASEIVAEATGDDSIKIGTQIEKDAPYAENITYRDCTPEEVAAWKESKKTNAKPASGGATPTLQNKPAGSLFNRK